MEFLPWPYFGDEEIQASLRVLKSGKVNQWTGTETIFFENEFSSYIGTKYAVALANGSLALDLSLMALDIGMGDEVIVTPRSFVASVSCVCLRGATPVFVDVDPISQNITLENISKAVSKKTKAVIFVHMAGWPGELEAIQKLCQQNGIALIEDCAQAHGASFAGKKVGSFGDCSIFSFCQDKIMTTGGEGGMFLTNNKEIWERVWSFKDHGKNHAKVFHESKTPGFQWTVDSFGTNCRMTEMQSAIGRVMLKKLDAWVKKRRVFAQLFNWELESIPGIRITPPSDEAYHSYYRYYVFINPEELKRGWSRNRLLKEFKEKNIPCNTGICPEIYMEKAFENYPFKIINEKKNYPHDAKKEDRIIRLPFAKQLGETAMAFLVHPTLGRNTICYVIDQLKMIMKKACY